MTGPVVSYRQVGIAACERAIDQMPSGRELNSLRYQWMELITAESGADTLARLTHPAVERNMHPSVVRAVAREVRKRAQR